jgi:hypothetical protein
MECRQSAEFANTGCRILVAAKTKNNGAAPHQTGQRHAMAMLIGKAEIRSLLCCSYGAPDKTLAIGVIGVARVLGRELRCVRSVV